MSLLEQLEVVRRVLSAMGEGEELQRAGEAQSISLCIAFQRVKTLKTDEKLDLIVAIEGLRMSSTAKGRLLAQVRGKCEATSRKRPLQDYVSWPNFCTAVVWRDITDNPQLASEILCQHLNSLGLILPSKDTEKSIAAHAIAGEYGQHAASVSEEDVKRVLKRRGQANQATVQGRAQRVHCEATALACCVSEVVPHIGQGCLLSRDSAMRLSARSLVCFACRVQDQVARRRPF